MCLRPFVKGGKAFGCGQCLPCRINRRRIWAHRLMLEALTHSESCFLTLTYSDANLPLCVTRSCEGTSNTEEIATLKPEDLRNFLKRLRKAISPLRIRYYACGEYGDETGRPHYHVALFGLGGCARGRTLRLPGSGGARWEKCCDRCRLVGETWGLGLVEVGELCQQSAHYVCGYVTKKMTDKEDERLDGRYPEFARMSLKPGIGYGALHEVARVLELYDLDRRLVDVPGELRHGAKVYPLGRYLQRSLRELVGRDAEAPPEVVAEIARSLQIVREDAFENSVSLSEAIVDAYEGKRASMIGRYQIFKQRRTL